MASSLCDGRVLITSCSGLTIISRYEFKEVEFHMYTYRGTIWDGEAFAGKGVGRVRIEPKDGVTVDVFTTHTIADSGTTMANNTWYRVKQVEELMGTYVGASNATAVILAGDLNTSPIEHPGEPYQIVRDGSMVNTVEELYYKLRAWLQPDFYTYGNRLNTYTGGAKDATTIDYIFHRTNCNRTAVWTSIFKLPLFKTTIFRGLLEEFQNATDTLALLNGTDVWDMDREEQLALLVSSGGEADGAGDEVEISLSDHEAVSSTIYVRQWAETWPYL